MPGISCIVAVALILVSACCHAQMVINEIMYTPESPEPEWVELFNAGSAPVDLGGWTISDDGGGRAVLPGRTVPPGAYIVLTRDSAALRDARTVRGALAEAALPSLNNRGDRVALDDAAGRPVDAVDFSSEWGGEDGRSLERRLYTFPSQDDSSWGSSTGSTGATPGRRNSIAPSGFDLAVEMLLFDGTNALAIVDVRNPGSYPSAPALVALYHDADDDGRADASELLDSQRLAPLAPGDSLTVALSWTRPLTTEGEAGLVSLLMPADEQTANNLAEFVAYAPTGLAGVVINEIMFDPISIRGRPAAEYVELRNATNAPINVAGWRLYDATLRAQATLPAAAPPIAPHGYLLVASDTTIYAVFPYLRDFSNVVTMRKAGFSLNGDEDEVTLRDRSGAAVDRVHYSAAWHRSDLGELKGIALERISTSSQSNDPRNWSSSAAVFGGTPGARNTLDVPVTASDAELAVDPPTVSPDGDGFEDFTRIGYHLPVPSGRIMVTAYDRAGRPVRTIANNEPAAAAGEVIFDGRDDDRQPLPPGIYLVRLMAYDDAGRHLFVAAAGVIVARRL